MDFLKQVGKMIEEEATKAQLQMADQQRLLEEAQRPVESRKRIQRPRSQQTQKRAQPPAQPAPATLDQMEALRRSQRTPVTTPRPSLKIGFTRKEIIKGIIISEVLEPKWKNWKMK
ncbi:MAG: hypothetical protein AB2L14_07955 [Candidatus Xenobiia bacterium LiM19]